MMAVAELCEGLIKFTYVLCSNSFSNSNSEQGKQGLWKLYLENSTEEHWYWNQGRIWNYVITINWIFFKSSDLSKPSAILLVEALSLHSFSFVLVVIAMVIVLVLVSQCHCGPNMFGNRYRRQSVGWSHCKAGGTSYIDCSGEFANSQHNYLKYLVEE